MAVSSSTVALSRPHSNDFPDGQSIYQLLCGSPQPRRRSFACDALRQGDLGNLRDCQIPRVDGFGYA